jgi:uncharacterized protein YggE
MIRTKAALAVVACMAGVVSGSIAGAQADSSATGATGTTGASGAPATITVNGSGAATIDSSISGSAAQTVYLTALGDALSDAHTHATTLAGAVGDTLGAVENITEQSNDGSPCSGVMFAAGTAKSGAPVPAVSPGTSKKKHHSKPKATAMIATPMSASGTGAAAGAISTPAGVGATVTMPAIARIADVVSTSCAIEASVTVTYAMSPS